MQQVKKDKKKIVQISEWQGNKIRHFEHNGGDDGKWPQKKFRSLSSFSSSSVCSPYPKYLGGHRSYFSGGSQAQVPNLQIMVPSRLHPNHLKDFIIRVIMASMRIGEIGVLVMVRLGAYNMSSPHQQLLGPTGPLFLLPVFLHQSALCLSLLLLLASMLAGTGCMHLLLSKILWSIPMCIKAFLS